jgi:hypothetical protein
VVLVAVFFLGYGVGQMPTTAEATTEPTTASLTTDDLTPEPNHMCSRIDWDSIPSTELVDVNKDGFIDCNSDTELGA